MNEIDLKVVLLFKKNEISFSFLRKRLNRQTCSLNSLVMENISTNLFECMKCILKLKAPSFQNSKNINIFIVIGLYML